MKRRKFLKGAAALTATPLIPKAALSHGAISPETYAKAVHWAGLWVHSTPATFKNLLGVDAATGEAVFSKLQRDGILGAANRIGVAKAVTPHYALPGFAARLKRAMPQTDASPATRSAKPALEDIAGKTAKTLSTHEDAFEKYDLETVASPRPRPDRAAV